MSKNTVLEREKVLKIGSYTDMANLVRAISGNIQSGKIVHCDSMGPNAAFVSAKACVYAQSMLNKFGINIAFYPSLTDVKVDTPKDGVFVKTAMRWTIKEA